MATGSHEESLLAEGIPDHHEATSFTRRRRRWSRRSAASSDPYGLREEGRTARLQLSRRRERREGERRVATGVSEARSHPAPWEEDAHARATSREAVGARKPCWRRSAEAVSDVVKRPVPRNAARSLRLRRGIPAAKAARGTGNTRGAGARSSFGWQTSAGRIARLLHRQVARPAGDPRRR